MSDPTYERPTTARLLEFLSRWRSLSARRSPQVERAVLLSALVVLLVAVVLAYRRLPPTSLHPNWPLLLIAAVFVASGTVAINGVEFAVSARLVGRTVGLRRAVRVTILGSAANILPIPGAALVRMQALHRMDLPFRSAAAITIAVGLMWVSIAVLMAGFAVLLGGHPAFAASLLAAGATTCALSWSLISTQMPWRRALGAMVQIALVEATAVSLTAARLFLILTTMGRSPTIDQAFALAVAAVVATAAQVIPGGIGLREMLSGVVGSLSGLPAAVGVLAAAGDRLLLTVILVVFGVVTYSRGRKSGEDPDDVDSRCMEVSA